MLKTFIAYHRYKRAVGEALALLQPGGFKGLFVNTIDGTALRRALTLGLISGLLAMARPTIE